LNQIRIYKKKRKQKLISAIGPKFPLAHYHTRARPTSVTSPSAQFTRTPCYAADSHSRADSWVHLIGDLPAVYVDPLDAVMRGPAVSRFFPTQQSSGRNNLTEIHSTQAGIGFLRDRSSRLGLAPPNVYKGRHGLGFHYSRCGEQRA
jgi:hypothetical protein